MARRLLSFDEEQARRGAYARRDAGLQTIEVARVVGSVGRAGELDGRFRYRSVWAPKNSGSRAMRLGALFESGKVPPLELYAIGDDLFVLDGHHRVGVALARGQEFLEAHIVEHLLDRQDPANQVYYERRAFAAATGLSDIHATDAGRYPKLLSRIRDHRVALSNETPVGGRGTPFGPGERPRHDAWRGSWPTLPAAVRTSEVFRATAASELNLRAAARDWREAEYLPVVEVLRAERIPDAFPGRAMGDLYGYVLDHCWYASERRGWDVGLESALADFVVRHAPDPMAEALIDPIVALGSDVLGNASAGQHWWAALAAGIVALPIAFVRGLRPRHYQLREEAV